MPRSLFISHFHNPSFSSHLFHPIFFIYLYNKPFYLSQSNKSAVLTAELNLQMVPIFVYLYRNLLITLDKLILLDLLSTRIYILILYPLLPMPYQAIEYAHIRLLGSISRLHCVLHRAQS